MYNFTGNILHSEDLGVPMLNYFQRRGHRVCGALFRRDLIISENITGVVNHEQLLCACIISFQGNDFSMIKNV